MTAPKESSSKNTKRISTRRLLVTTILAVSPALAFTAYFIFDDISSGAVTNPVKIVGMAVFSVIIIWGYFGTMSGLNQRLLATVRNRSK